MKSIQYWAQVLPFALALGALALHSATAAPAPWYLWQSRLNGEWLCAQVAPGEAWVLSSGPFRNASCKA